MVVENIIDGAKKVLELTWNTIKDEDDNLKLGYPGTSYNLPIIYGLLGKKVENVKDLKELIKSLKIEDEKSLENALNAGVITLICAEALEALKYAKGEGSGFIPDEVLRGLGVPLVEKKIPAIFVVVGSVGDKEKLKKLIEEIQKRNILALFVGKIVKELEEANIEVGLDKLLVPIGEEITKASHAANLAIRAPLIFGNVKPGDTEEIIKYLKERVPAVVLALGELDNITLSAGAGCIKAGIPVITDNDVPVIEGALEKASLDEIVDKALKMKGIEVKVSEFKIPVSVGPMNEGERIRKPDMYVELAGPKSFGFELVKVVDNAEDKVEVIGKELDEMKEGERYPFAIIVKVSGDNLEEELEGVLERRIHEFFNYIEGVMHLNQRDQIWIRIGKESFKKGLRLKHIGEVVKQLFKEEFPFIKSCEVTIITDPEKIKEELEKAKEIYKKRDERTRALKEEDVDVFYGCIMCQSFAPTHVCVITPDRPALCGGINYLDARAAAKIDPNGPIFEIPKGECLDETLGVYSGVNEVVSERSQGSVESFCLHSALNNPCTSCGCFEAVVFYIPEVDGFGVVHRNFKGETPLGLPFSSIAGQCSGGKQVPGFVGVSIGYMMSPKFLQGDGGWKRVVWLPKELKERVKEAIPEELYDKIATEEDVSSVDELIKFLKEKGHPIVESLGKEEVEEVKEEKEEEEKEGLEFEDIKSIIKERGIQIIMKNVKIVININMKK
ncbi:CO dehydrogenase/acetyl-CoA synthase complex, beta subunit [Methanocaldococcus infernus ME]|uniref:Acetyl-CoA decarbonylase/synthase complex subunit beta n=1 Tax=Methanocaldococcus infernus (strain DSM 11812 / JCM 15783 / ME) TaxID=573063 RepID=D5VTH8_METIM|nr:acetyl-CoA decarbonylase/synthase complex subunit alpha/beta [Methanocaldococcus infernus]ADG13881.1 CO dehydrogenase/acetyl-CoA synthase complex, beta subunit [Methanocaldococcus infernus ME]